MFEPTVIQSSVVICALIGLEEVELHLHQVAGPDLAFASRVAQVHIRIGCSYGELTVPTGGLILSLNKEMRRHSESFYRDPEVDDENDPAFIVAQLRPDEDFRGKRATQRFPFDDDQADAIICHVQGGSAVRVTSNHLRQAFAEGTTGDPDLDDVMLSVLNEINRESLEFTLMRCGASPREIAAFYRARPHAIRWPVVLTLNYWSDKGQRDLPFVLDKLAAVDCEFDEHF